MNHLTNLNLKINKFIVLKAVFRQIKYLILFREIIRLGFNGIKSNEILSFSILCLIFLNLQF